MKILILGDVHVGKGSSIGRPGAGKGLNSRIQDQIDLLDWVLDTAFKKRADAIFITGDVYEDPRPHPTLINLFMSWLKKCEKNGVEVHILAGNHDIIRTGSYTTSALDLVPSVEMDDAKVYKNVDTVHLKDLSVTLVPYRDRRMYEVETTEEAFELLKQEFLPELKKIPEKNKKVLIGHLALEGSICIGDEIDDELNEIFCPPSSFKDWDYTWMGHVHNPHVLHKSTEKEPYHVAHIGSMERSDFSKHEMSAQKIIVLFDSEKDTECFEEIPIPNRNIYKVDITVPKGSDTTDFVKNYLDVFDKESTLLDSIIKLNLKLAPDVSNADRSEVLKHIYDTLNAHYVCYFSESRMMDSVVIDDESVIDNSMTPELSINTYWDHIDDISDEVREECRTLSLKVNKEFEELQKK